MPLSIRGVSPLLLRVSSETRADLRQFVVTQRFDGSMFLQFFQQAHEDVFGMLEVSVLLEFVLHHLRGAVYDHWTEDNVLLLRCIV